jgi:LPS-assembly lipoprotein
MSWSETFLAPAVPLCLCLCLALPVAGCGFTPMYADKTDTAGAPGALAVARSTIFIANIPDRNGQYLRNQLIDRLYLDGRPADPAYTLTVTNLQQTTTNLGIRRDATATRAMYELDASMTLKDNASGKILLQRNVRAVGGYNELDNQFATLVSRQNLRDNMLQELSDTIVSQLDLYFDRAPKGDITNVDTVTPLNHPSPLVPMDMQGHVEMQTASPTQSVTQQGSVVP